jgi:hypothetical protein
VATSFLKWGQAAKGDIQKGDVLVQARGLGAGSVGGHVGMATGNVRVTADGTRQIEMISGNKSDRVTRTWENASGITPRRALAPDDNNSPFAGASGAGSGFKHTFYAPGASGPGGMEGPYATSRPNPNLGGARLPTTLDDVRAARAAGHDIPVSLAGDPRRYGQSHKLGSITYRGRDGVMYTLDKVTGYVHDTGGAFKGRMDKLDIAAIDGRTMNDRSADRQMAGNRVLGGVPVTRSMEYQPDFSGARERDRDRSVMSRELVNDMASKVVTGKASIDIDVAGARANQDWGEKKLFKKTRSKAAPQMPNSIGGEPGDERSGSDEGPATNEEE